MLGIGITIAGLGISASPTVLKDGWQRHAPSSILVALSDITKATTGDGVWTELLERARFDQLSWRNRRLLAEKLAKRLDQLPRASADDRVRIIVLLRPPSSRKLEQELTDYGIVIAKEQDRQSPQLFGNRAERSELVTSKDRVELLVETRRRYRRTIEALGYAGSEVGRDFLVEELKRVSDKKLLADIVVALARIGDERSIEVLYDFYLSAPSLRPTTALAIASNPGLAGERAVTMLREVSDPMTPEEQWYAQMCIQVLRGEEDDISILLSRALGQMHGEFSTLIHKVLTRDSWLFEPGSPGRPELAVPVLVEYLSSKDDQLRFDACLLLRQMGPNARTALPALQSILQDDMTQSKIQRLVRSAIDSIRRAD